MHIDKKKCLGCGNCVAVCPMGAIYIGEDGLSEINSEACVECGACFKGMSRENLPQQPTRFLRSVLAFFKLRFQPDPDICPTGAITEDVLTWPRTLRRNFSNPQVPHSVTGLGGRGTYEVKTNEISGRIKEGEIGFTVELGRPGTGVYFREVDRVSQRLASMSIEFQKENPLTVLMIDPNSGKLRTDILQEKVISCILEFKASAADMAGILKVIEEEAKKLDTIIALGVAVRCRPDGNDSIQSQLQALGYDAWRGKINLGLGRHTNPEPAEGGPAR